MPLPVHEGSIPTEGRFPEPVPVKPVSIRGSYTFTLKSINILHLRSQSTDTDYASFTVKVTPASGAGITISTTKKLGDLKAGVHDIGLVFKQTLGLGDAIVVNYIVVNAGHSSPAAVEAAIKQSGEQLSLFDKAVADLPDFVGLLMVAEDVDRILGDVEDIFKSIFDGPNCDGVVAVEQDLLVFTDLPTAASGPVVRRTVHAGTDSPHGCGANSSYEVTWEIELDPA